MISHLISKCRSTAKPLCAFSRISKGKNTNSDLGDNPLAINSDSDAQPQFSNEPFVQFLKNPTDQLQISEGNRRTKYGKKIYVPYRVPKKQEVVNFFEKHQIRDKTVLVDVDSSHLLGIKRAMMFEHMAQNVMKSNSEPLDKLSRQNPSTELMTDELLFSEDIFFMTDPKFVHLWREDSGYSEEQADQVIQDYYDTRLERGVERLRFEYKLPEQFLPVIEAGHNMNNQIYFCGLNEYELRELLWLYHSLAELKTFFIRALHYWKEHYPHSFARTQSDSHNNEPLPGHQPPDYKEPLHQRSGDSYSMNGFQLACREFIHKEDYSLFQPHRYQKLKLLRKQLYEKRKDCFCFAHKYAYVKTSMTHLNIQKNKMLSKDSENEKIEKHAILEVMLGDLWNQTYTRNKFPYLSENFLELSKSDQQLIEQIFNKNYNLYETAIKKFRVKYLEKEVRSEK